MLYHINLQTFTFSPSVQSIMIAAVALKLFQEEKLSWKSESMRSKSSSGRKEERLKDRRRINDSVNSALTELLLEHMSYLFLNE